MRYSTITPSEFDGLSGLPDWRVVHNSLVTTFCAGSFQRAATLIGAIASAADAADHHPDVNLRYPDRIRVAITTHATGGLTQHDVALAKAVSALAAAAGATAEPTTAQMTEVAIDTMDADRIRPFWAAVMAYNDRDGYLSDPAGSGPSFWFQQMDEPRSERQRFHIDVIVSHDAAQARIEAALAAGGRLVTDRFARAWWVLADADGNEACVCTWQDRG